MNASVERSPGEATGAFFACFMPQLITAGDYALHLQHQLGQRTLKEGDAWTSVLTDADLGVQHYIEAAAMANFPDWMFFGEEHEQSFNTRYFAQAGHYRILIDPINGTRLYRDGADSFDILMSLARGDRLIATLSYMPARRRFFGATAAGGAFTATADAPGMRLPLRVANDQDSLALYQAEAWSERLPTDVAAFDLKRDYDHRDPRCCMNSLFTNELGGYLMGNCNMLDVGATAFTATAAGGVATRPDGRPFDYFSRFDGDTRGDLLVCANPALHERVVQALSPP
jgi:fructose-1,6-bisphosphatase/inositol monophosphatase family enzyme